MDIDQATSPSSAIPVSIENNFQIEIIILGNKRRVLAFAVLCVLKVYVNFRLE